jgi:hypothetical protein
MNTTAAGSLTVGQQIATIPSVASDRSTRTEGTVTAVNLFTVQGVKFADVRLGANHRITLGAAVEIEVIA